MADGPFGFYTVPTPSKPKPSRPPWLQYLLGYIVPGLMFFAVMQVIAWLLAWFT